MKLRIHSVTCCCENGLEKVWVENSAKGLRLLFESPAWKLTQNCQKFKAIIQFSRSSADASLSGHSCNSESHPTHRQHLGIQFDALLVIFPITPYLYASRK